MAMLSARALQELGAPWVSRAYEQLLSAVLDKSFPCHFGAIAQRRGEISYGVIENNDWSPARTALVAFCQSLRNLTPGGLHGVQQRTPVLVILFEPEVRTQPLPFYTERFWSLLQYLHDEDPDPWPEGLTTEADDHRWQFTFASTSFFCFFGCPAYERRRSRNYGDSQVVLFQPRAVFNGIEGDTPAGQKAREIVRGRARAYEDLAAPHQDQGWFGDAKSLEWKQYVLGDDDDPIPGGCPLRLRRRKERKE